MESLFFEPEIVDSLFLHHEDLILSTFIRIGESSPLPVVTTLARLSLFPHLRIAVHSLDALHSIVQQDPAALPLHPSPIFPSSSPHQQYSGFSFLAALTKKLRTVFSQFHIHLPTDPSHLPKYVHTMNDDPFFFQGSLEFCAFSLRIPALLLNANPPIEVDSEIIQELLLFEKEALTMILTDISTIDSLVASLPSDSSPATPMVSGDDTKMVTFLFYLRNQCEDLMSHGWCIIVNVTHNIADPHKSSFQRIILDDPSFPDLILNSLKLNHEGTRKNTIMANTNTVIHFPSMKEKFLKANLVGRMFETVDFVSLPLSKSQILFELARFISVMFIPVGDDEEALSERYPLIRVSVFEPAKQFIIIIFRNLDKLVLSEEDKTELELALCWIHRITNMELRSDEHDAEFVSELVKWEVRTMIEMENGENFKIIFESIGDRTWEWNRDKRERLKRREVRLIEEGWDDVFELRVVGMEVDTNENLVDFAAYFGAEQAFNVDESW